jgi:hypothetical protein
MVKTLRIVPILALLAGVTFSTTACAQGYAYGGYGRGPDRGGYAREIERRAYDRGYREGLEEGRNDAQHRRDFSPRRHSEYRDADEGYHRGDGDREFYRSTYRRGFEIGYREAYDRNVRYDRGRDWRRD